MKTTHKNLARHRASRLGLTLALFLLLPFFAFGQELLLQTVQYPEDRDVDVELTPVHPVKGSLDGEVEFEDGDADVRLHARGMLPALAYGGDVTTYVVWAIPPSGRAERLGELPILEGDEKTTLVTDLKDFALLVTLEEHAKVRQPSSLVVFQNLATDDKGAVSAALTYSNAGSTPRLGDRVARLNLEDQCDWQLEKARTVYSIAEDRNAAHYAPDQVHDARLALSQAEAFLDTGRDKESIDYAQRSISASSDALLMRSDELSRQAELAAEAAERRARETLAQRATAAENEGERLEDALHASERNRLTLQQKVAQQTQQLGNLKTRETQLVADQQQAQQQLDDARAELKALDMDRADARARADQLMQERARLSKVVGDLATEKQSLESERQALIAEQANLQQENQDLAQQAADAEAERARLAKEKEAVIADLFGTLSEIADTKRTARGLVVSLPDILFDFDKSTLKPEGTTTLAKLAGVAILVPELEFSIEGHTDSIGSDSYNDWLSRARAQSVADFLTQEGVASTRMETEGYGEGQPVASNDTTAGRQQNRRVEVVIDQDSLPAAAQRQAKLND